MLEHGDHERSVEVKDRFGETHPRIPRFHLLGEVELREQQRPHDTIEPASLILANDLPGSAGNVGGAELNTLASNLQHHMVDDARNAPLERAGGPGLGIVRA